MKCFEIEIKGRVQGVFFRNFTKKKATSLDIKGFVQNKNNGNVFIIAQGNEEKKASFLKR